MNTEVVAGIIAATSLLLAAIIGAPRIIRDPLNPIAKQVEIYNSLPATSSAKAAILERIEQQVNRLDTESSARRNAPGIALGIILLVAGGTTAWLVLIGGGWWWLLSPVSFVLLLMGTVGFFQGAERVPRAANGQSLDYQRRQAEKAAKKSATQ